MATVNFPWEIEHIARVVYFRKLASVELFRHIAPQNHEIVLYCCIQKPFNSLIWGIYFKTWTVNDCKSRQRLAELLGKIPVGKRKVRSLILTLNRRIKQTTLLLQRLFAEWFIGRAAFLPDNIFFRNGELQLCTLLTIFFVNSILLFLASPAKREPARWGYKWWCLKACLTEKSRGPERGPKLKGDPS